MSLKILCWNIRHGGRRTDYIISALLHHRADVILLTEYRANAKGAEIKSTLLTNGWVHQVDSEPPQGKNGVLIVSLYPLERVPYNEAIPAASHRWLTVTIGRFILTGAYFPQRHEKVAHWRYMMHLAKHLRDTVRCSSAISTRGSTTWMK